MSSYLTTIGQDENKENTQKMLNRHNLHKSAENISRRKDWSESRRSTIQTDEVNKSRVLDFTPARNLK